MATRSGPELEDGRLSKAVLRAGRTCRPFISQVDARTDSNSRRPSNEVLDDATDYKVCYLSRRFASS